MTLDQKFKQKRLSVYNSDAEEISDVEIIKIRVWTWGHEASMELAFQIQDLGDNFQVLDSDARFLKISVWRHKTQQSSLRPDLSQLETF